MKSSADPQVSRRDWLKVATLGSAGSLLGVPQVAAQPAAKAGKKARGVIFMVSDGMSPGVLTLAESFSLLARQRGTHWWKTINHPNASRGLMDTASANSMVTDSAAASSAWGGGQRVNNGSINVLPDGRPLTPIAEVLGKKGVRTGLVSTATITHATPAGFAASCSERGAEEEIAVQYLDRVDILLGGGSGYFSASERPDKRDLSGEFAKSGYGIVSTRDELLAAREPKLLGTFSRGHMPYAIDRAGDAKMTAQVPTLTEMATAALNRFLSSGKPFLLQIEGARIDHAAHRNDIGALLWDQLAFDDALGAVLTATAGMDDILIIVTSDHGNANPGLNGRGPGYQQSTPSFAKILLQNASFESVFADWQNLKAKSDFSQLTALVKTRIGVELKKPEAEALIEIFEKRPVLEWNEQLAKPEGLLGQFVGNHTSIGWTGTSHTSDPTLVTALGPQSDRFGGMVINKDIFGHLVELLG
jgi:alkaline phosphatase